MNFALPATSWTSARALLRNETSDLHAAVDRGFSLLLTAGLDGYRSFLRATAAAVLPLEHALATAGVADLLADWPERARSAALLADLAAVGIDEPEIPALSGWRDEAGLFGALYVLEGSRLGARVLRQRLSAADVPRLAGITQYLCHGEDRPLWPRFLACLEASPAVRRAPAAAVAGARAAFVLFAQAAAGVAVACTASSGAAHGR